MYKLTLYIVVFLSLLFSGAMLSCSMPENIVSRQDALPTNSPANASYFIENDWVQLVDGLAEWPAAPGGASKVRVAVKGETTYGNLTGEGHDDAVIFLTYQSGGSGTFYYLAAALQKNEIYQGTNTIWLGDRIGPPSATVKNGLIIVEYLDRKPDQPMTTKPTVKHGRFFKVNGSTIREIKPAADETVYQGWLTIGHEVRSFLPCDENGDLWLLGNSPAMSATITSYKERTADLPPYSPVFVILSGRKADSPTESFGADYSGAFAASQLVHTWPKGNCKSDLIMLNSPLPGEKISSPLTITGRARGTWFFEGDFPVTLEDGQGGNIAVSYATAKGEWMTTDFVEFVGTLEFNRALSGQRGTLILKKDNPTDQVKFDEALEIPVNFY